MINRRKILIAGATALAGALSDALAQTAGKMPVVGYLSAASRNEAFTRAFRRETGMSFAAWRQNVRLIEALSRLAVGEPVTRVALDVGYNSPSAFAAMFRRAFGACPTHYLSERVAPD